MRVCKEYKGKNSCVKGRLEGKKVFFTNGRKGGSERICERNIFNVREGGRQTSGYIQCVRVSESCEEQWKGWRQERVQYQRVRWENSRRTTFLSVRGREEGKDIYSMFEREAGRQEKTLYAREGGMNRRRERKRHTQGDG